MENSVSVEGSAKDKKYQGGDPRHQSNKTRAGNPRDVANGKKSFTSGSSNLRSGTKLDEYERTTTNNTKGKKVDWNR